MAAQQPQRHIISILIENEAGALARVAGLFAARGYNIEALTVAPTHDPTLSSMTIVTEGEGRNLEQIVKQLNKLVDTVRVRDVTSVAHIERELMLVKVRTNTREGAREEIKRLADIFEGRIIDVTQTTYIVELVGSREKLDAFLANLTPDQIIEVVRSGQLGIMRGEKGLIAAPHKVEA